MLDSAEGRALHNIADIQLIDSYYRNAGRSCDMKQSWDKDDSDWQLVLDDAAKIESETKLAKAQK